MTQFNLDELIDRSNTDSSKYQLVVRDGTYIVSDDAHLSRGADRMIQLWVADMDFLTAPAISNALSERVEHAIYGYTSAGDGYYEAITDWYKRRYEWEVDRSWILHTPGVVAALNASVRCFTEPGDKVLLQSPVYHPFRISIEQNGRSVANNPLLLDEATGRYTMDFDDLARQVADPEVKLALLCSPHNPVGRVWTSAELTKFAEICLANDVIIVADELHCDLIFSKHTFVPLASLSETFADQTITCMAPSKTFNLAGLKTSQITISNPEIRETFTAELNRCAISKGNPFGVVTTEAAYRYGEPWLNEVNAYMEANYDYMCDYLAAHLPQLKLIPHEGTYLVWADFRAFGLPQDELIAKLLDEAKVHLSSGAQFGPGGEGFMRINIATARANIEEAMQRIARVFGES